MNESPQRDRIAFVSDGPDPIPDHLIEVLTARLQGGEQGRQFARGDLIGCRGRPSGPRHNE
jgi:hypothetical protein